MKKVFRYLHRQPKHVRDGYAFGAASVFTGIIFLFWFISFPSIGSNQPVVASKEENTAFSTLLKQSKEQMAQLWSSVSDDPTVEEETAGGLNEEIILKPEDIAKAQQDLQKGNDTNNLSPEEGNFEEVIIGTTSTKTFENQNSSGEEEAITTID